MLAQQKWSDDHCLAFGTTLYEPCVHCCNLLQLMCLQIGSTGEDEEQRKCLELYYLKLGVLPVARKKVEIQLDLSKPGKNSYWLATECNIQ